MARRGEFVTLDKSISTDNFDYLNARLRVMHGKLLSNEHYKQLLSLKEVETLVDFLLNSPYAVDLSDTLVSSSGYPAIEITLRENLSKTMQKVLSMAEGRTRYWIGLLLSKWDIYNIKTIIRGKLTHQLPEDIFQSLVPMATLKDVHLKMLIEQEEIKEVISLLATWGYNLDRKIKEAIIDFYNQYPEVSLIYKHLIEIENLIDRWYFEYLVESLKTEDEDSFFVQKMVASEIDFFNLTICLKLVSEGSNLKEKSSLFIKGGLIKEELLGSMLGCQEVEGVFSLLEKTEFSSIAEEGSLLYGKMKKLSIIERLLEGVIIKKAARMYSKNPLSISIAIGYLWEKYNEFVNLKSITWGIKHQVPPEIIKGELIFV
ncbi:V-type ATPase subunit [bacterium]|nr:V-type ATPase subunit [bacterium]